jgi:hypothetical protein
MEASSIGHALEGIRPVAKAPDLNPGDLLLQLKTRGVRGHHPHVMTPLGGSLGDPGDKGAGRISRETRIIMGDREDAE